MKRSRDDKFTEKSPWQRKYTWKSIISWGKKRAHFKNLILSYCFINTLIWFLVSSLTLSVYVWAMNKTQRIHSYHHFLIHQLFCLWFGCWQAARTVATSCITHNTQQCHVHKPMTHKCLFTNLLKGMENLAWRYAILCVSRKDMLEVILSTVP